MTAIILAAGQGTRMKSDLPKVMHSVCGRPIVDFSVRAALDVGCGEVMVVVGHGRRWIEEYLAKAFAGGRVRTTVQDPPRGTGDAARVGLDAIRPSTSHVLVMNGDVPLLGADELRAVAAPLGAVDLRPVLSIATCVVADPAGYGRVLRRQGDVLEIREHRDLRGPDERAVCEINAGIYAASVAFLRPALASLVPNNAQGELYLTDIVGFAANGRERMATVALGESVLAGINDREQLASVERMMQARILRRWRLAGVTIRDGVHVDAGVVLEPDVTLEAGVVLRGETRIARGALVDIGCVLTDVEVGEGAKLKPYTVATESRIGVRAQIGPFSHLRPQSDIGEEAHLGNFVETKKTRMGRGSKANHLAYLGDGILGERANVGAGTIFCNYDGVQKHTTSIEAGAFIGSDSQLVAPVTVGADAYVATGTTVTRDVPPGALAIGRIRQENKEGYAARLRARLEARKKAQT
ncbi:MAG: bifunctional UDP-N-acetylglucosamine diphosphorylase/glucosamine-1-phosphate N-acetyltransferase GlmU [Myxococcota bacterium]|nr:bifunctional UDP-N-acetylglucosamine diphosphorylase/glucosamine-1-phosphate N-acetyltransferase GlmU [Myxococcota bacterium]